MPNTHRRRIKKSRKQIGKKLSIKRLFLCIAITCVGAVFIGIVFLYVNIKKVAGLGKPIYTAIAYKDGLSIIKYDPLVPELLEVAIPGNITLDTAGGFGKYSAKNIYKLSCNEKTGDGLFKKTIMKNFNIPIHGSIDCSGSLSEYDINLLDGLFRCSGKGNIANIIFLFYSKRLSGENVIRKDLSAYRAVIQSKDGEDTMELSSDIFSKIEFDFSQNTDIKGVVNVGVSTENGEDVPYYFNNIIKILGGRVVGDISIKPSDKGGQCVIIGKDTSFVKNVAMVFGCTTVEREDAELVEFHLSNEFLDAIR